MQTGTKPADARRSESITLIDFETAKVVEGIVNDTYILIVTGTKPYLNMEVRLSPLIYIDKPDYWQIEVVGLLPGIGLPALGPYIAHLDLGGVIGKKGIEVVGATKSLKFDVPPSSDRRDNIGDWTATIDTSGTKAQIVVDGTFPTNAERPVFTLEKAVPQGFNPAELILILKFGELVDPSGNGKGTARYSDILDDERLYSTVLVLDPNGRTIAHINV
jgi:hypothetical protein